MSDKDKRNAIIVMVVIQIASIFGLLVAISSFTQTPSTTTMEQRIIVLPVYSPETIPETSIGVIQDRMEDVARYFDECSYSQVSITSSVEGWILLDNPMDSYAETQQIGGRNHGGVKDTLFLDAITNVDAFVDFSQFDRLIVVQQLNLVFDFFWTKFWLHLESHWYHKPVQYFN